jgi:putative transposase
MPPRVLRSEGVRTIKTAVRAPRANAYAERWVRTVRAECLDWTLVLGRRHLERVLWTYEVRYNHARPHRGLELRTPQPRPESLPCSPEEPRVRRREVLAVSSTNTNSLLEVGSRVCVPFRLDLSTRGTSGRR